MHTLIYLAPISRSQFPLSLVFLWHSIFYLESLFAISFFLPQKMQSISFTFSVSYILKRFIPTTSIYLNMQGIQLSVLPHQRTPNMHDATSNVLLPAYRNDRGTTFRYHPTSASSVNHGLLNNKCALSSPPCHWYSPTLFPPSLRILRPVPLIEINQPIHTRRAKATIHTSPSAAMVVLMARCCCQPGVRGGGGRPQIPGCCCWPGPPVSLQSVAESSPAGSADPSPRPDVDHSSRRATRLTVVVVLQHHLCQKVRALLPLYLDES